MDGFLENKLVKKGQFIGKTGYRPETKKGLGSLGEQSHYENIATFGNKSEEDRENLLVITKFIVRLRFSLNVATQNLSLTSKRLSGCLEALLTCEL